MRDDDVHRQRRNPVAAVELHLDLVGVDADVAADDRQDLVAENGGEVRLALLPAFVFEQDLQPLAGDRRGATASRSAPGNGALIVRVPLD